MQPSCRTPPTRRNSAFDRRAATGVGAFYRRSPLLGRRPARGAAPARACCESPSWPATPGTHARCVVGVIQVRPVRGRSGNAASRRAGRRDGANVA
ncbi:hypothetical protein FEF34_12710 [Streptomyces marianii]|uniref:Uncharacterized protein n=1 Tax=Streptomyces marianii TaxID=1817406 RepID=A0A5R9E1W4_9ACTN|nr:hypothetical protein FEF34_12710 [Streptomyces marianii]